MRISWLWLLFGGRLLASTPFPPLREKLPSVAAVEGCEGVGCVKCPISGGPGDHLTLKRWGHLSGQRRQALEEGDGDLCSASGLMLEFVTEEDENHERLTFTLVE